MTDRATEGHRTPHARVGGRAGEVRGRAADPGDEETVLGLWLANVRACPERAAIRTRRRTVSYRELERQAARYRDGIAAVAAGPVVIACADPVETVAAILGAMAAQRPFAPVDVRTPASRLGAVLEGTRPRLVVADGPGTVAMGRTGTSRRVVTAGELPEGDTDPARWTATRDRGYIYFTSGTTGRPKGFAATLRAVAHFVTWEIAEFGVTPGTRVSSLTSPGFDAFLRDAFVPLCAGGTMCAAPRSALAGEGLARWLAATKVNVLHCVPTVFRTLHSLALTPASLPDLRTVLMAGEPVRAADVRWWRGLFGDGKDLVNLYGPSETTMTKLFHRLTAADADAGRVPVGVPMPGVGVRLLGGEDVGEVELRVPFPLPGYLGGEPGGFDPGDPHVYRTGDLGRFRPDGALELLGRRDRQVKLRGVRVEPDDVAGVLLRHPAVHDVHVTVEGEDSEATLRAYVVWSGAWDERDLLRHAREHLPSGMVPARFVRMTALPRTLNGKVDRGGLPHHAAAAP
ncbi:AMP-binding protein [Sphaerisporangium sp. B11E5]|uniref:AMP-binding protein n=1 Tax=Sphaerisporangium sp. B11E5 TaxID=3153563 RepID=UPI00325E07A1